MGRKDVEGYPTWEEIVNQVKILMIMVCYPTWEEIVNQVRAIEANQLMSVQTIGRSLEGRPIQSVSVTPNTNNKGPLVWIICGLHAREWVSPLFCVHILHSLIQDLPSDFELQNVSFKVVPI